MSKIDKIIQIVSNTHCTIVGLSESGKLYRFNEQYYGEGETKTHHPAQWILEIESPVVDNSACEEMTLVDAINAIPDPRDLAAAYEEIFKKWRSLK